MTLPKSRIPTVSNPYSVPSRDYVYDATLLEVYDGDTVVIDLDLGLDTRKNPIRCRLNGVNAKGRTTPTGKKAKAFLEELFPVGAKVRVETLQDKREKYGRYLLVMHHPSLSRPVNDELIERGLAEPYYGVGKADDKE